MSARSTNPVLNIVSPVIEGVVMAVLVVVIYPLGWVADVAAAGERILMRRRR